MRKRGNRRRPVIAHRLPAIPRQDNQSAEEKPDACECRKRAQGSTHIPPEIIEKGECSKADNYTKKWKPWVEIFTLTFVAVYTIVTFDSFISGNRAFVYFENATFKVAYSQIPPETGKGMTIFNSPTAGGKVGVVGFRLTNAGNTPTKNARVQIDCLSIDFRDDARKEPFNKFVWDERFSVPDVLGPKETIEDAECEWSEEKVLNGQMGISPIYILGEIRYYDRVSWWPFSFEHITEFSKRIDVSAFDLKTGIFEAHIHSVGLHNCTDDECKF